MNINQAFASKYLKASDIPEDHPVTVIVDHVDMEVIGQGKEQEEKPVAYFVGKKKGMVMNKTNCKIIAKSYGPMTEEWAGKPIVIVSTEVEFQGDIVPALRVRVPTGAAAAPAHANGGGQGAPVRAAAAVPTADISTIRQQIRDRAPAQAPFAEEDQHFDPDSIPFRWEGPRRSAV